MPIGRQRVAAALLWLSNLALEAAGHLERWARLVQRPPGSRWLLDQSGECVEIVNYDDRFDAYEVLRENRETDFCDLGVIERAKETTRWR